MAATTATFGLRKLIQARLSDDNSTAAISPSANEDGSSSAYIVEPEIEDRNPVKKRLTHWLSKGFKDGPNGQPVAVRSHSRTSSRTASPLLLSSDSLRLKPLPPIIVTNQASSGKAGINPNRKSMPATPSAPQSPAVESGYFPQSPRSPRPKTFLFSPSNSYMSERSSKPMSPPEPESETIMLHLDNGSDPEVFRRSTNLSDDLQSFIKDTDRAFESVGERLENGPPVGLPEIRQSIDDKSQTDITTPSTSPSASPKPLHVVKRKPIAEETKPTEATLATPPQRRDRMSTERTGDMTPEERAKRRLSRSLPPLPSPSKRDSAVEHSTPGTQIRPTPPLAPRRTSSSRVPQQYVTKKKKISVLTRAASNARRGSRNHSRPSRWNLSENITEILTGERFKKVEADEMLTPERLVQLKKQRDEARRQIIAKARPSLRSTRSTKALPMAPVPEKKVAELEAEVAEEAGSGRSSQDSSVVPSISDKSNSSTHSIDSARASMESDLVSDHGSDEGEEHEEGLKTVDLFSPSPLTLPLDTGANLTKTERDTPPPSVALPEVPLQKDMRFFSEEDDQFYYLKSTPHSLVTPQFRHGPIAFAKSEVGRGALTMDDTLDWTAFQMAILGGAGDYGVEIFDDDETKVSDEISSWFNTFGFETTGGLVPEATHSVRSSSQSSVSTAKSIDHELPIPISQERVYPSYQLSSSVDSEAFDATRFYQSEGMKPWTMDGYPVGYQQVAAMGEDDEEVTGERTERPKGEEAKMGFNLENDLGSFLNWQAEYAYAG